MKTGYKGTYDFVCRGHKFEIGQIYELPRKPILCEYGFHYCINPIDVYCYYPIKHNFRLLEIEDLGESVTEGNKTATNKIRIIREIPKEEYYQLFGIVNNELTIPNKFNTWEKHGFNERNNRIRYEDSSGYWEKYEYDERNNIIRYQNSSGYWEKREYDERNNQIYRENTNGYYVKRTYDENNKEISWEDGYKDT